MEKQRHGDWRHLDWRHGDIETWRLGEEDVKTMRHLNMETGDGDCRWRLETWRLKTLSQRKNGAIETEVIEKGDIYRVIF